MELFIERKKDRISIQGGGIGDNQEEAKKVLQDALDALNSPGKKEVYRNEISISLDTDRVGGETISL